MNSEIPEKTKLLIDATLREIGLTPTDERYTLLMAMVSALFTQGHARGVRDIMGLIADSFGRNPVLKASIDQVLSTYDNMAKEGEKMIDEALSTKKKSN